MKNAGAGSSDQFWRHPKKNWLRGFENALVRICGLGWRDAARGSRGKWQNPRREFISEAVRLWNGPRLGKLKGKITPPASVIDVSLVYDVGWAYASPGCTSEF